MKNVKATTIFLCFFLFSTLQGQTNLNFSAGVNLASCQYKQVEINKIKARLDYFIGIAPTYQINDKIQILCNVQYSRKGFKGFDATLPYTNEAKYSYIDVIPEVDYEVFNNLKMGMGINTSFKVSEAIRHNNSEWVNSNSLKTIKSFDFGLTGKIQYSYNNIFVFARYYHGFSNILNTSFTNVNGELLGVKQFNRNFQFGVGYTLNLKRNDES